MTTLYQINNLTCTESSFTAEITFNPAHQLFSGHFPGQPIVPGVVLVEISAAVMSRVIGKSLIVKEASVIKFLKVIDPTINPVLLLDGLIVKEDDGKFKADLSFYAGSIIFAKLRGIRLQTVKE